MGGAGGTSSRESRPRRTTRPTRTGCRPASETARPSSQRHKSRGLQLPRAGTKPLPHGGAGDRTRGSTHGAIDARSSAERTQTAGLSRPAATAARVTTTSLLMPLRNPYGPHDDRRCFEKCRSTLHDVYNTGTKSGERSAIPRDLLGSARTLHREHAPVLVNEGE